MMDRRRFLLTSLAGALAAPLGAIAQSDATVRRVGFLGRFPPARSPGAAIVAFTDALGTHGYVDGKNLKIEFRWSHGDDNRWPDLVRDLVAAGVHVVVTADTAAALAMKQHATATPVVLLGVGDPAGTGLIASLAHPGGNITGLSNQLGDLVTKSLELVRDVVPGGSRVAVLWNPHNAASALALKRLQEMQSPEKLTVLPVTGRTRGEIDEAFTTLAGARPEALIVHAWYADSPERTRLVDFAIRHRIPTFSTAHNLSRDGLLLSYAPSFPAIFRRGAVYVDKILKGATPGDLPVEQPTEFELVINLKTAKSLGLTIPPSLLLRADQVIQ